MAYGQLRNTGIPFLRNYNEAQTKFEKTKPIAGKGANGGRIALGHRHKVAEFYMEKKESGAIECICYRTPVVTFHPDGNIELKSGGWSSQTTAYFIEDVLPASCRVRDSSLVIGINGGEFRIGNGLMLSWVDGRITPLNVEPDHVYRVKRKEATKARQRYAEFIKYFNGMIKVREDGMAKDSELVGIFGTYENQQNNIDPRPNMPSDVALRNKEQVEKMFEMIESEDYEMRYKACLLIMKQFGKRHYWKDNGYSITVEGIKKAMNNLIFARHKEDIFEVVEVPLGTIKKDAWSHLF